MSVIVSVLQKTLHVMTVAWTLCQYMLKLVLQTTLQILMSAWTLLHHTQKLVPYPSPLEMVACVVVLDTTQAECQGVQTILATSFGDLYACTLPYVGHTDVLGIRTSDFR